MVKTLNKFNTILIIIVFGVSLIGSSIGANINWPFNAPVRGGTDIHSAGRIMQTLFATGTTFATNPYYNDTPFDGSTGGGVLDRLQYIQDEIINAIVPVGSIIAFDGVTPPNNWLIADGSCVPQTLYPRLYNILNDRHGTCPVGDFKLPDLRGRVIAGMNNTTNRLPVWADVLGGSGGSATHTLTIAEMPTHNHDTSSDGFTTDSKTNTNGSHDHGGNSGYFDANHTHNFVRLKRVGDTDRGAYSSWWSIDEEETVLTHGPSKDLNHNHGINSDGNHIHNIYTLNNGGSQAHNNIQPTMTFNYIIKY